MVLAVYWTAANKSSSKIAALPLENATTSAKQKYQTATVNLPLRVQVVRNGLIAHCSKEHYLSWLFINNLQNRATVMHKLIAWGETFWTKPQFYI